LPTWPGVLPGVRPREDLVAARVHLRRLQPGPRPELQSEAGRVGRPTEAPGQASSRNLARLHGEPGNTTGGRNRGRGTARLTAPSSRTRSPGGYFSALGPKSRTRATTNCRPEGRQFVRFRGWRTSQRLIATFNKGFHEHCTRNFMNTPFWRWRESNPRPPAPW